MTNNNTLCSDNVFFVTSVNGSFGQLLDLFGEPDGSPTDVVWTLKTPFGVATIRNNERGVIPDETLDWSFCGDSLRAGWFAKDFFTSNRGRA